MNIQHKIKPLLITLLLCCTTPLSAETEPAASPAPWHVENSELRAPVKVDVKAALLRMPPQVYLADLKPLETTDGLAFDPLSKKVMQTDVRDPKEKATTIAKLKQAKLKPQHFLSVAAWEAYQKKSANAYGGLTEREGGPILQLKGSVTVALKPEYQFFTWRGRSGTKVFIDGKEVRPERIDARYWQKGMIGWQDGEVDIQEGVEVVGHDAQFADHHSSLVAIPSGAKTLKLEVTPSDHTKNVGQAGFITRYPKVARATICLPGRDASRLIPVVYRANGERVGCRVVWASKSIPMTIMFDSSSGEEDYWVYLLDEAKKPAPLAWMAQAEIMEEARQLDRYNPELETLAGFEKLWGSAEIVGRGVPKSRAVARHATRTGGSGRHASCTASLLRLGKTARSRSPCTRWWAPSRQRLGESAAPFIFRQPILTSSSACPGLEAMCCWTATWSPRFEMEVRRRGQNRGDFSI